MACRHKDKPALSGGGEALHKRQLLSSLLGTAVPRLHFSSPPAVRPAGAPHGTVGKVGAHNQGKAGRGKVVTVLSHCFRISGGPALSMDHCFLNYEIT